MSNSPTDLSIRGAGESAPALTAIDAASGRPVDLGEVLDAAGDAVLLYWLKTGCPTCRLAAPFINRLAAASEGRVRAIFQDESNVLDDFRAQHALDSLVAFSEPAPFSSGDAWGITSVPSWFWVELNDSGDAVVRDSGVMFSQDALQSQFEVLGGRGALFTDDELASLPVMQPG